MNPTDIVKQQRIFHEVNERIADITADQKEGGGEFLCECGREDCTSAVALELREYRDLHAQGLFLVAKGHRIDGVDRLVEQRDGYDLVAAIQDR